jgi:hypothetical protein
MLYVYVMCLYLLFTFIINWNYIIVNFRQYKEKNQHIKVLERFLKSFDYWIYIAFFHYLFIQKKTELLILCFYMYIKVY